MALSPKLGTVVVGVTAMFGITAGSLFGGDDTPPDLGDSLVLPETASPTARLPDDADDTDDAIRPGATGDDVDSGDPGGHDDHDDHEDDGNDRIDGGDG